MIGSATSDMKALIRLIIVIITIILLPRLLIKFCSSGQIGRSGKDQFRLGIENMSDKFLRSVINNNDFPLRIALLTNHAAQDQFGNRNIDIILSRGINIKKIIAPQHGYWGDIASGVSVKNSKDKTTDIPILTVHDRQLKSADIADVDIVFFDLQDVGIQHYEYVRLLLRLMEVAAAEQKMVVVFDRPNLLGGGIEGVCMSPNMAVDESGIFAVPMRYGMTIGELALYYHRHVMHKKGDLQVVPMAHYHRQAVAYKPISGKLSPNISSIEACLGYSFLGVLGEVAPFDIGIGTTMAFRCILLPEHLHFPKHKWYELREILHELGVESSFYRYLSKRKKIYCSGLRICVHDVNNFSLFKVLVTTLSFFKQEGVALTFSDHFSTIPGMNLVKGCVEGYISQTNYEEEMQRSMNQFFASAVSSCIYYPLPKVIT